MEELIEPSPLDGLAEPANDAEAPLELAPRKGAAAAGGTHDFDVYAQEGPLLGDNPLDMFATEAATLELEVQPQEAKLRVSRPSPSPATGPAARRREQQASALEGKPRLARRSTSKLVWLAPGALLLVLLTLLLAPSLFSAPVPDDTAAQAREAQNPATRNSQRHRQPPRPIDPTKLSPAQRELTD
jgi:hypothetical protein